MNLLGSPHTCDLTCIHPLDKFHMYQQYAKVEPTVVLKWRPYV